MQMKSAKKIHIMGRGRSGSSLLDTALGGGMQGSSVGELLGGLFGRDNIWSCVAVGSAV